MDRKRRTEKINPELGETKKAKVTNQLKLKENARLHYPKLYDTRTNKLNKLLDEVVTRASIGHGIQEIRDIQTAVHTVLEKVVTRVNKRGRFKISRIVPCGSMVERTTVLKFDYKIGMYTEFDFLANLDYSPNIICRDNDCGQCVKVGELPVSDEAMSKMQEYDDNLLSRGLTARCDHLFRREVNTRLGSDCQCFSVQYDDNPFALSYSYKLAAECESDYRCDKCVVEMPTGILRVNHSVFVGPRGAEDCSLAFMWTSKANTLPVYDHLLQEEARQVTSLPVHVDFLPALEVLKAKPDEAKHDFFLVPKHCNVCGRYNIKEDKWRKSNCMAEIAYLVNEMSEKHRKCYKIIKYFLSTVGIRHSNGYYVKTVTLNHSRECSDSSEGCAECVLKILTDLKQAYETETLTSFHEPGVSIFSFRTGCDPLTIKDLQKAIERLSSAPDIVQLLKQSVVTR